MATRRDPLDTLRLAIELLHRIPKRGTITGPELHEQMAAAGFPRSRRTIQRLLKSICNSGKYHIECFTSGKTNHYCVKECAPGFVLGGLSTQESLLLMLAEQQLRSLLPAKLMKSMDGFFTQARTQLSEKPITQREREWLEKVRVVSASQPLLPPKIYPGVFDQVSDALYGNQWLDVDYKNAQGKRATYRVMPLGLVQQGPRMYLVCRYEGFEDDRFLGLHRMISATASTLTFERPQNFNLQQLDDNGRFGFGDGTKVRLSFRVAKEEGLHVVECPLSVDQQVVELEDSYEITATVVDSAMLDWWLRGFGDAMSEVRRQTITSVM